MSTRPINQDNEQLARLFKMFPVARLKGHFGLKGTQDELIQAILGNGLSMSEVVSFVGDNVEYCKQHTYVLAKSQAPFPVGIGGLNNVWKSSTKKIYLAQHQFSVLINTGQAWIPDRMTFTAPVVVEILNNKVWLRFVVVSKDLQTYAQGQRVIRQPGQSYSESQFYAAILTDTATTHVNLTKGIRHLWDNDVIDAVQARHTGAAAVTNNTMHEALLLKKDLPTTYNKLKNEVLNKSRFVGVDSTFECPEVFTCDPETGQVDFPRYASSATEVRSVVSGILANN